MLRRFNLFQFCIGCIAVSAFSFPNWNNAVADEFFSIDLDRELKKGNFFIYKHYFAKIN